MSDQDNQTDLQIQINDLQEKLLYQEDTLQKLDEVVGKQYTLIDTLNLKLNQLEDQLLGLQDEVGGSETSSEKPPHY